MAMDLGIHSQSVDGAFGVDFSGLPRPLAGDRVEGASDPAKWDGKRPLWSSGLQVDYLKYVRYLVLLAYLLCFIILKSVCLPPRLGLYCEHSSIILPLEGTGFRKRMERKTTKILLKCEQLILDVLISIL